MENEDSDKNLIDETSDEELFSVEELVAAAGLNRGIHFHHCTDLHLHFFYCIIIFCDR
jgi:hypothetical protein